MEIVVFYYPVEEDVADSLFVGVGIYAWCIFALLHGLLISYCMIRQVVGSVTIAYA